jgi:hypothetical protein
VDPWPVVTVTVAVTGATLVVANTVVVVGMVVVKRHVGRGIGYFDVQNFCAAECFDSGVKTA